MNTNQTQKEAKLNYMKTVTETILLNKFNCNWEDFEKLFTNNLLMYNESQHMLTNYTMNVKLVSKLNANLNSTMMMTPMSTKTRKNVKRISTKSFYNR